MLRCKLRMLITRTNSPQRLRKFSTIGGGKTAKETIPTSEATFTVHGKVILLATVESR